MDPSWEWQNIPISLALQVHFVTFVSPEIDSNEIVTDLGVAEVFFFVV